MCNVIQNIFVTDLFIYLTSVFNIFFQNLEQFQNSNFINF